MVDRIQKIINWKKLTASAFADQIGVPRSTISHIISGRNNPSLDLVQKILDTYPDIKTEWLVRGTGNMVSMQHALFSDDDFESENVPQKNADRKTPEKQEQQNINQSVKESEVYRIPPDMEHMKEISDSVSGKKLAEEDIGYQEREMHNSSIRSASRIILLLENGVYTEYVPVKKL